MLRSFIHWILLFTNLVFIVCMLFCFFGGTLIPENNLVATYLILFLPVYILINVAFLVFWLIARRWFFLLSLFSLILSYSSVMQVFPLKCFGEKQSYDKDNSFTVMSYNTHLFAFHKKHLPESPNKVIQTILDSDADVVCLQEFEVLNDPKFLNHEDVLSIFNKYPYKHIYYKAKNKRFKSGIATFSKFPILRRQDIPIPSDYNSAIFTDILIGIDTIRMINCHLESNKLTEKDKSPDIAEMIEREQVSVFAGKVSKKLMEASRKRTKQASLIQNVREKSPYRSILCGDLNDTPFSHTYTKVKGDFMDTFTELSCGYGATLNEKKYKFRIDYIFCDRKLNPLHFYIDKVKYSDHYPLFCVFEKNTKKKD